jgi:DNA-binding NtrC family response regulator
MNFLLIDDDDDILELISLQLNRLKYTVFAASTLLEAEKILLSEKIHVVVSDLILFHENGIALYEKYHSFFATHSILFILTTGNRDYDTRILCYMEKDPFFVCLEKPYSVENVLSLAIRLQT